MKNSTNISQMFVVEQCDCGSTFGFLNKSLSEQKHKDQISNKNIIKSDMIST